MPELLRVYRVEHLTCNAAGHGPFYNKCDETSYDLQPPQFGGAGSGPRSLCNDIEWLNRLGIPCRPYWQCGVTLDQIPFWSYGGYGAVVPEHVLDAWREASRRGWGWTVYEVPVEEFAFDNGQIVFAARDEYWVDYLTLTDMVPVMMSRIGQDPHECQQYFYPGETYLQHVQKGLPL